MVDNPFGKVQPFSNSASRLFPYLLDITELPVIQTVKPRKYSHSKKGENRLDPGEGACGRQKLKFLRTALPWLLSCFFVSAGRYITPKSCQIRLNNFPLPTTSDNLSIGIPLVWSLLRPILLWTTTHHSFHYPLVPRRRTCLRLVNSRVLPSLLSLVAQDGSTRH